MAVKIEKLSGAEKAALFILSLGESNAGEILNRLDDREVQILGQRISRLEVVPTKQLANIIEEFNRMMEAPEALVVRGDQFFKNTISRTMDIKRQQDLISISELKAGAYAKVSFIRGEHRVLQRLLDMGLTPGTSIKVERVAPLKGPVEVCVRGSKVALGQDIAANVFVEISGKR